MQLFKFLKKSTPVLFVLVLTLGILNSGSYDPYNELGSLTPDSALATGFSHDLTIPFFTSQIENKSETKSEDDSDDTDNEKTVEKSSSSYKSYVSGTCKVTADRADIFVGSDITINWTTSGFSKVTLNGEEVNNLSGSKTFSNLQTNTTYTLVAKSADGKSDCTSVVKIKCLPLPPVTPVFCELTLNKSVDKTTAKPGDELTYTINIKNTGTGNCTGGGVKIYDIHDANISFLSETHTENINAGYGNNPVYNASTKTLSFNGNTLTPGEEGTITWKGKVNDSLACGTNIVVKNTAKATAQELENFTKWAYSNTVVTNVSQSCDTPLPKCTSFYAEPQTLPAGGGQSKLIWATENATIVNIDKIGDVAKNDVMTVDVSTTTTYKLTASDDSNNTSICYETITVTPKPPVTSDPITCANNVNLSISPSSVSSGDNATISWSTTAITSLSFDNGITSTGLSGTVTVSPTTNTTYKLTATDGKDTISCPIAVSIKTSSGGGGGGGGSSSPTCELTISANKIKSGDDVKLVWNTSRATGLTLVDSKGKTWVTTDNLLGSAKDELLDGSITVTPTSDTTYTLIADRGSRDTTCKVKVTVDDVVVVSQVRDQQPLIAGIALTDVPYTGFEAGPILTVLFYILLMLWAIYIAYLVVIRRRLTGGYAGYQLAMPNEGVHHQHTNEVEKAEEVKVVVPEVFKESMTENITAFSAVASPSNLPTSSVIGYANLDAQKNSSSQSTNPHQFTDEMVTEIENYAHTQHTLLSSDAIRHFVATTGNSEERLNTLKEIITSAKNQFPAEDGWVVINEKRMQDLCTICSKEQASSEVPFVPAVIPEGSGSLAEAIVTGNIIASYEMIGHRPMFALADAAADFDSVYRTRKGGSEIVSDMLLKETTKLTDEQLLEIISALSGALDGTYTDEASAVKMAIMKAVKVVA